MISIRSLGKSICLRVIKNTFLPVSACARSNSTLTVLAFGESLPPRARETSPLSSETTSAHASHLSVIPMADLCRVPHSFRSPSCEVSGKKLATEVSLPFRITAAPSCNGVDNPQPHQTDQGFKSLGFIKPDKQMVGDNGQKQDIDDILDADVL